MVLHFASRAVRSPTAGVIAAVAVAGAYAYLASNASDTKEAGTVFTKNVTEGAGGKKQRVAVDARFLQQMKRLLSIVVPGPLSKESFLLVFVAAAMVARTYCDLWVLKNGTAVEASIIARDPKLLARNLGEFILAMLPISFVNQVLKYGLQELALRFRTNLTKHLFAKYMRGFTYYKICNLDTRISNPDQLLTQDVERFCQSLADLYSNLSKPLLDMVVYSIKLTDSHGVQGPGGMLLYLAVSGVMLTRLRRPLGRFTVREQALEGDFRYVNSRLITNSEEVAFYGGNVREKMVLDSTFSRLVNQLRTSINFRFSMGVVDNIVAKYLATLVGYIIVSRPFMSGHAAAGLGHTEVMQHYYRSGRMLLGLAQAVGRLVLAGRELTRLAGFTSRVDELIRVLDDLNNGKYQRTMVTESSIRPVHALDLNPDSAQIIEQDRLIRFERVPLVTPNGDVLVPSLDFEVAAGCNVLICGPNGCGKSSLFRVLGGLWPIFGGKLTKPAKSKLFYVPQRPYLTLGTLRDQIIYPHTTSEFAAAGGTDEDLKAHMTVVRLAYIIERDGGFDAVQDWQDVLSGGEKQRVAMARLFYHRPQFAILDECTSAVSVDVEADMYNHCKALGVTLFTVSHRKTLWKHHSHKLEFDGRGAVSFGPIPDSEQALHAQA